MSIVQVSWLIVMMASMSCDQRTGMPERFITVPPKVVLKPDKLRPAHNFSAAGDRLYQTIRIVMPDPAYRPFVQNMLKNGGFENFTAEGPAYWRDPSKGALLRKDDSAKVSGQSAIRILISNSSNFGIRQTVKVSSGSTYLLTGYIKTEADAGGVWLEVQDAVGGFQVFSARTSPEPVVSTDWIMQSVEFVVPTGVESINVFLRKPVAPKPTGDEVSIWFDDVRLQAIPETYGNELLPNGDFENQIAYLQGWQEMPIDSLISQSTDAIIGEKSIRVELADVRDLSMHTIAAVEPNTTYYLCGYIKTDNQQAITWTEVFENGNESQKCIATGEAVFDTNQWSKQHMVFDTSQSATSVKICLRAMGYRTESIHPVILFDGYSLRQMHLRFHSADKITETESAS